MRRRAKRMEERPLPIPIEAFGRKGEIVAIYPRTAHTRLYKIRWENGLVQHYKGAATRPSWVRHILPRETI